MSHPKVYIFANGEFPNGDLLGTAIADDGTLLAQHLSSNAFYLKHDMGVTSKNKHDIYMNHHKNGFEVVFVADPSKDPGLLRAIAINQQATAMADAEKVGKK